MTDNYRPKTACCWQCGITEGKSVMLEQTTWIGPSGREYIRPTMRFQCQDEVGCDERIRNNAAKARIIGLGPVRL